MCLKIQRFRVEGQCNLFFPSTFSSFCLVFPFRICRLLERLVIRYGMTINEMWITLTRGKELLKN